MSTKWRGAKNLGAKSEQCNDPKRNVSNEMNPTSRQELEKIEEQNVKLLKRQEPAITNAMTTENINSAQLAQPSSRVELEAQVHQVEKEMMQAGEARDFAGALQKEQELSRLNKLRDQLPDISEILNQLNHVNSQLETAIKARQWQQAKLLQDRLVGLERQLSIERNAESSLATSQHEAVVADRTLDEVSLSPDPRLPRRQYSLSSASIGWGEEVRADCLTAFLAAPLVWMDNNGKFHPFPLLNFQNEKKLLADALKDAHDIGAEILVRYEPATTDRLAAFLAADPSPVLHFSGHGHAEYLAIENDGAMQSLSVDKLRQFIAAGSGQLKVVFVSACHSEPAGDAFLKAGIPHVVCCRQSEQLRDTAAVEFARNFYRALACNNTLRESFHLARQAVMVSPSVVDAHLEMDKFLLLPEKPENDPYHDVQVFYTRPMRNRSVSSYFSGSVTPKILPSPPDVFVGREIIMYKMIRAIKESRWVQITGQSGVGKFSLAAAVCRYMHDRTRSFFLDEVFWFSPFGEPFDDNELSLGFHELFSCVRNEEAHESTYGRCCKKIAKALIDMSALIFIDARELGSTSELGNLDKCVQDILRRTHDVKIVVVYPSGESVFSRPNAVKMTTPPLDFYSSVLLFGNLCPFVSRGQTVESSDDLVDILVPETQADATTVNRSMSLRSSEIFRRVGEGLPAQIRAAATNMAKEQFKELIRVGQRPEPRAQIDSRVELENEISRLSDKVDMAASSRNFLQAQELQDTLEELQNLRENLPSLAELKLMEAKLQKELNAAVASKFFTKANKLQKSLHELMARTRIEEEAHLKNSYNMDSAAASASIETPLKTVPLKGSSEIDIVTTEVAEAADGDVPLHYVIKDEPDELKSILDPLRDLDDDLISEQMEHFAPGTREWAVRSFDSWVSSEKEGHRVFVLVAQAGVGKTGIVCKLVRDRPEIVVAYHFCRHDDSRRSNPKNMLMSLAYQLAERFQDYRALLDSIVIERRLSREELVKDHNVVALFELLLREPLSKLTVDKSYVILIDALDECEGKNEILLCIQRHFTKLPPWLKVYATARPEFPIMDRLKKFNPIMIQPEVEENMHDLRVFFGRLLDEFGAEELSQSSYRNKAIETLVEKSGGLFIYASFLADMIHSNARKDLTLKTLEEFPQGLDEFYDVQFTRMFPDEECLEWRATKTVITAAEPLHVDLIQAFVKCTRDERMAVIRKLSEFFPIDQNRKVHVYHKSLTDWLTANERQDSEFYVDLLEEERFLAIRCVELLAACGITSDKVEDECNAHSPEVLKYALRHGIAHLCSAGMYHEARKLLLNIHWLFARVEAGEAYETIMDCQMLEKGDRVVELIGRAVGLSLNALRANPHQLPGQLVGRLLGSTLGRRQDDSVRQELSDFVVSVQNFQYGFKWWCPLLPTWDQAEQPCLRTLAGHTSGVKSVACSKDGTVIVSGSNDRTVRVWDALSGHCEHVLKGHKHCVHSVALLESCGKKIASGSEDKTIRIWDAFLGDCEQILEEKGTGIVWSVAWFEDGTKIVSGSGDGSTRIWNVSTRECEKVFRGHSRPVVSVALSPDEARVVSGSFDKTCRVWNVSTGACEHVLTCPAKARVPSVAWSSRNVVFGSWGKTILLWDDIEGECERILEDAGGIVAIALSVDGTRLASGLRDNSISLWDTKTGLRIGFFHGHANSVYSIAWSSDGTRIVSGATDRSIRIWDATAVELKGVEGSNSSTPYPRLHMVNEPAVSRNDPRMEGNFKSERHSSRVNRVSWSDDGSKVATASSDQTIRLWDPTTGRCVKIIESPRCGLRTVAWSMDGTKLVSGSFDGATCIWDASTGECEKVLTGHTDQVLAAKWCNHGSLVCTGSRDKLVIIWDVAAGEYKLILEGHTDFVNSVGWSKDDSKVGSASTDKTVRIWDAMTGACLHILEGHTGYVYSVRWSYDGSNVVSRSHDETVRIWDPTSGECKEIVKATHFPSTGLECDRFYRDRNRACGVHYDQSVNFFVEKG